MKLKYRLAGIYLLTAVLPVIVLFTFSYGQMKHILIERDTKSIQNFVNQAGAETLAEVRNILITARFADIYNFHICIFKHILCLFHAVLLDKFT